MAAEHFDKAIHNLLDDDGIKIWVSGEYCPNRLRREASQARGTRDFGLGELGVRHGDVIEVDGGGGHARLIRVIAGDGLGHVGVGCLDDVKDEGVFRT